MRRDEFQFKNSKCDVRAFMGFTFGLIAANIYTSGPKLCGPEWAACVSRPISTDKLLTAPFLREPSENGRLSRAERERARARGEEAAIGS